MDYEICTESSKHSIHANQGYVLKAKEHFFDSSFINESLSFFARWSPKVIKYWNYLYNSFILNIACLQVWLYSNSVDKMSHRRKNALKWLLIHMICCCYAHISRIVKAFDGLSLTWRTAAIAVGHHSFYWASFNVSKLRTPQLLLVVCHHSCWCCSFWPIKNVCRQTALFIFFFLIPSNTKIRKSIL